MSTKSRILLFSVVLVHISVSGHSHPYFSNARVYYAGNTEYQSVHVGEFDGDGFVDLFILNDPDSTKLGVLVGKGSGEFEPYIPLDIDCSSYGCKINSWLVLDYQPRDDLDDIVVVYGDEYFTVHRNSGSGSWSTETVDGMRTINTLIGSCDCDGDNEADILSYSLKNSVNMYLSTIPTNSSEIDNQLPDWSYVFPLGDYNGDGLIDVTVSQYLNATTMYTFFGYSDCMFFDLTFPFGHQTWGDPWGVTSVRVGDFNGDGYDDIVYSPLDNMMSCYAAVYYGSEAGLTFNTSYEWTPDCNSSLLVVDANSDNYDDIGVVDTRYYSTENTLPVYLHFSEMDSLGVRCDTLILQSEKKSNVFVSDLSGDGYDDLYYFPTTDSIAILINKGHSSTLLVSSLIKYLDNREVHLEWEISTGAVRLLGFQIYRRVENLAYELIATLDHIKEKTAYSYVDDVEMVTGNTLGYQIFALNSVGASILLAESEIIVPKATMRLLPNFPNPFNPGTRIMFELSSAERVWLEIFDVSGRVVAKLIQDQEYPSGLHAIDWNGTGVNNSVIVSGIYYLRLKAGKNTLTQKITLLK